MKILVVCKNKPGEHEEIKKIFDCFDFDILYSWKNNLTKKEFEGIDLVVSIGGDGTVLSAAHFMENIPLLAVNSSPGLSVGALTTLNLFDLKEKLEEIKNGNFKTENLERIIVSINEKNIDYLALNEVFIANEKVYHISKYKLNFNGKEEIQRSSGLIFSTGTGSSGWFRSAGGVPFSPQSKFIKMIVREPYCGKEDCNLIIKNIEIKENEKISIIPVTKSLLSIDSNREFILNPNDIVKIEISKIPLRRII